MRKAVSVTLESDNLLWLRAQAAATSRGSLSEVLDRIVRTARTAGRGEPAAVRSVVGSIDLAEDDPDLHGADAYIGGLFAASARRPVLAREQPPKAGRKARRG